MEVDLQETTELRFAEVEGDLELTGTVADDFTFTGITVGGDLILNLDGGEIFNFDGIEVEGEIIIE